MHEETMDMLRENAKRTAEVNAPFDPLTGLNSTGEREKVTIKDFPTPIMYLPKDMMREPFVKRLLRAKTVKNFMRLNRIDDTTDNRDIVVETFIRVRVKYDFPFWAYVFAKIDNALIDTIVRKASPYKMTDEGERLYRKSKADVALRNMKDRLLSAMDEKKPRTEYDVEQAAIDVLLSHTGDEAMDEVKRFVYYSPDRYKDEVSGVEVRFDFFAIVRLMSIALRDIYLDTRDFPKKAC